MLGVWHLIDAERTFDPQLAVPCELGKGHFTTGNSGGHGAEQLCKVTWLGGHAPEIS
jgi:hypothetical protein